MAGLQVSIVCLLSIYIVSHAMDGGLLKGPAKEPQFLSSYQGAILEVRDASPCEFRRA